MNLNEQYLNSLDAHPIYKTFIVDESYNLFTHHPIYRNFTMDRIREEKFLMDEAELRHELRKLTLRPIWEEPTLFTQYFGRMKRNPNTTMTPEEKMHRMSVELAFLKGEPIQYRTKQSDWDDCIPGGKGELPWDQFEYRIKPKPVVIGDNIAGLTAEQIEIDKGYRLLTREEKEYIDASMIPVGHSDIERWTGEKWSRGHGNGLYDTYRTRMPFGHEWNPINRIAVGHNPDKLTNGNVGKGWRLLSLDEVNSRTDKTDVQMWMQGSKAWSPACAGNQPCYTYRTRHPLGFFLQKDQNLAELWRNQPIVWVRGQDDKDHLVLVAGKENYCLAGGWCGQNQARRRGLQYSFDRKTWHKF